MMELIVAVDARWAIGREGKLLFSIPDDLHRFKELTWGRTIVYGRKTLETFPGKKPLPGRTNLVLTHHPELLPEGATAVTAIDVPDDCIVVGGASVYEQFLARCSVAHVTKILADGGGDSFFPDLDAHPDWQLVWQSESMQWRGLRYCFCKYIHI